MEKKPQKNGHLSLTQARVKIQIVELEIKTEIRKKIILHL